MSQIEYRKDSGSIPKGRFIIMYDEAIAARNEMNAYELQ